MAVQWDKSPIVVEYVQITSLLLKKQKKYSRVSHAVYGFYPRENLENNIILSHDFVQRNLSRRGGCLALALEQNAKIRGECFRISIRLEKT